MTRHFGTRPSKCFSKLYDIARNFFLRAQEDRSNLLISRMKRDFNKLNSAKCLRNSG
jgi:hypothetical protein